MFYPVYNYGRTRALFTLYVIPKGTLKFFFWLGYMVMKRTLESHVHEIRQEIVGIFLFVGAIWLIFALDQILPLEHLGLIPRTLRGIPGIIASPFLHKNLAHIASNTVPLIILLMLLAGSRSDSSTVVTGIIILGEGLLWLFGRGVRHIGASSLLFGLITFLVISGILEKRWPAVVVAIIVAILYGTTLFRAILPFQPGISWDGHLFGAVAGVVVAWNLAKSTR